MIRKLATAFFLSSLLPCSLAIRPAVALPLEGTWNGFLNQQNVLECANASDIDGDFRLQVRRFDGESLGSLDLSLKAFETAHFKLNDFPLQDSYGSYFITSLSSEASVLHCENVIYRFTNGGASQIDYAYFSPPSQVLVGESAGIYNSMDPEFAGTPVLNWLSLLNPSNDPLTLTVRINPSGGEESSQTVQLAANERRDIPLGHPLGQQLGLYRIEPQTLSKPYVAFLSRYKRGSNENYSFAFPLRATSGTCDSGMLPASTMDPADNWGEIANTQARTVTAVAQVFDAGGALLHQQNYDIPPFGQQHVYLNHYLGERAVGSFRVRCGEENTDGKLLVQSLFYGFTPNRSQLEWAYASQAPRTALSPGQSSLALINTHLGAANWSKYFSNGGMNQSSFDLAIYEEEGSPIGAQSVSLHQGGTVDVGLHELLGFEQTGFVQSSNNSLLNGLAPELIRVIPGADGTIDYIFNVQPAVFQAETNEDTPVLVPGNGFNGITSNPGVQGSPADKGFNAQAIARWDVVPYQTIQTEFYLGIVAFHIAGINRAEFSVEGGPWAAVDSLKLNPRTGVAEYWVKLRPSDFPDGLVEVRAIVYPNSGIPRVLSGEYGFETNDGARIRGEHSLFLYANSGGSLSAPLRWVSPAGKDSSGTGSAEDPFQTINAAIDDLRADLGTDISGARIYLTEGNHHLGAISSPGVEPNDRWLVVQGAPGTSRELVRITSTEAGRSVKSIQFKNLTIDAVQIPNGGTNNYSRVWLQNVLVLGGDPTTGPIAVSGQKHLGGIYFTGNSEFREMVRAVVSPRLARNIRIDMIGGDAFRELQGLAANIEVTNSINTGDGTHNDLMQWFSPAHAHQDPFQNIIIYGFKAVENIAGQSFFMSTGFHGETPDRMNKDIAVVNYITKASGGGGAQWGDPSDHILFWNYTILDQNLTITDAGEVDTFITNFSLRNSVLDGIKLNHDGVHPDPNDPSWADNNHYIKPDIFGTIEAGTNMTQGGTYEELFVNPAAHNFHPRADSVLGARTPAHLTPLDAEGLIRPVPGAIGALREEP